MKRSVESFFSPKSLVLIGASNKPGKVGYALAKNLLNFKGKVFFVNKKKQSIFGKEAYSFISEIKENIELAIIAVPAQIVPSVLEECGVRKIKSVIIISAGFSESGNKSLEKRVIEVKNKYNLNILGPNCFGVVNNEINLDATFAKQRSKKGSVAFISQSGALWSAVAEWSKENGLGFSKFISLGDALDLEFNDLLPYVINDKATKVILLYIEALKEGREFMNLIKSSKKPVIILKAGKTSEGSKAALSHTGSLAGSYEVYKAACKQAGAIVVETLTQSLDLAKFYSMQSRPKGKRVVVVTNAGGPGILAADCLIKNKLQVVNLPKDLKLNLPQAWSHRNPIDVLGDADFERYREVFSKLNKDFFDILFVIFTPQQMANAELIAKEVIHFKKSSNKTIIACFMGFLSIHTAKELLEEYNIPCFFEIERAVSVVKFS